MSILSSFLQDIEKTLETTKGFELVGKVTEVKDGVVIVEGLTDVAYGEVIKYENGSVGYVIDLLENNIGSIVLGPYSDILVGSMVKTTGKQLSVPVSDKLLSRVVNPLGEALDGKTTITTNVFYPVEKIAPGVIDRKPISVPLQTGIKSVDALTPIGRGQRQLIIGDRGTGKTTLTLDTIINQKGKDVICIYCAIGQKQSTIASVIDTLESNDAMNYTVVVAASATEQAAMQFIAPYAATAIAEYFMDKGKDVLVIYDDLTKHAYAYREVSLILRRPAGREAYPGDVFYLHSRLLERACRLNEQKGGGSLTALPIIQTLEGDISTYIPTNVISITDGQVFLQTDLFNAGMRPAVDVGLSVSRVGGAAQTKAMKQVAGKLKLDLAQFREMESFAQFEGDLDEATRTFIHRGRRLTQILKQKKNKPYRLALEVAVIFAATRGYLDEIPVAEVEEWEEKFISRLETNEKKLLDNIEQELKLTEALEKDLIDAVKKSLK